MNKLAILLTLLLSVVFAANGQSVTGSFGSGTVEKGKAARGQIVLTIPGGLHVNSSRPASEYAIPTSVRLSGPGVRVGRITYPRGRNRKFQFSEDLINVYEGRVSFPFTVTVPANFRGNTVRVNASVRYQACTEEVCYPPKTKQITLTAKVK
ncbi:MAG TPA: protein-disulfide reductase DsbD N-terminal domain-containing protein [Pyrinomonadaceae bacterium]|nr:protein-disulfide reductase DsbD N-terminal domain-containing protein [Pyrinomonadaceae bacterium]